MTPHSRRVRAAPQEVRTDTHAAGGMAAAVCRHADTKNPGQQGRPGPGPTFLLLLLALLAGCAASPEGFDGARFLAVLTAAERSADAGPHDEQAAQLVRDARSAAADVNAYTALFEKQQCVDGRLRPLETVELALREDPFSVRMKWISRVDRGRDVLYVEGENNDRLRVYTGNLPVPAVLDLDPEGALALEGSRYPITRMGLRTLARGLLLYRGESQPAAPESFRDLGSLDLDGRAVRVVGRRMTGDEPGLLLFGLDAESRLAVMVARYAAPSDDCSPPQLLDLYRYRRLNLRATLDPAVFDFARFHR